MTSIQQLEIVLHQLSTTEESARAALKVFDPIDNLHEFDDVKALIFQILEIRNKLRVKYDIESSIRDAK